MRTRKDAPKMHLSELRKLSEKILSFINGNNVTRHCALAENFEIEIVLELIGLLSTGAREEFIERFEDKEWGKGVQHILRCGVYRSKSFKEKKNEQA